MAGLLYSLYSRRVDSSINVFTYFYCIFLVKVVEELAFYFTFVAQNFFNKLYFCRPFKRFHVASLLVHMVGCVTYSSHVHCWRGGAVSQDWKKP